MGPFGRSVRGRKEMPWKPFIGFVLVFFCLYTLIGPPTTIYSSGSDESAENVMNLILSALGSRNTTAFVKPLQNTLLIDSLVLVNNNVDKADANLDSGGPEARQQRLFALVVVISEIGHEEERAAIRDTWSKWSETENVRVVFFLGVPPNQGFQTSDIKDEIREFNDIVVDDFEENYYLLSVKVLRMFKWFISSYPEDDSDSRPEFLIKVDHDVFLNIPNLVKHLRVEAQEHQRKDYVGGRLASSTGLKHNAREDSFIPTELLPETGYPDYLVGGCYFIQSSVVPRIYNASLQEQLFIFEDVFLTGMIAQEKLGISLHDVKSPDIIIAPTFMTRFFGWNPKDGIAYHPADPGLMRHYYAEVI